jgi:hypothetical protein
MLRLLFGLMALTNIANASDLPQWYQPADNAQTLLKGEFEQQKKTKHLRRPIKSSGTILLSSTQGIAWQTLSPVKSTMVITTDHIVNIDSSGKRKKVSGGSDLNLVFLNALTGNWTLLEQHFDLTASKIEQHCVLLQPKTTLTQKTLKQINVCGSNKAIESLSIEEVNGGTTDITMALKPYKQLTDQEQLLFSND